MATRDPLIIKLLKFYSYLATICIHILAIQRIESLMDAMQTYKRSEITLVQSTLLSMQTMKYLTKVSMATTRLSEGPL